MLGFPDGVYIALRNSDQDASGQPAAKRAHYHRLCSSEAGHARDVIDTINGAFT